MICGLCSLFCLFEGACFGGLKKLTKQAYKRAKLAYFVFLCSMFALVSLFSLFTEQIPNFI